MRDLFIHGPFLAVVGLFFSGRGSGVDQSGLGREDSAVSEMALSIGSLKMSVVSIKTTFTVDRGPRWKIGSGFVFHEDGFVLTRRSVVEGGDSITVTFSDGRRMMGWVVGADETADVVVLKLPVRSIPAMRLGETTGLRTRSEVLVLGNSLGVFPSLSMGFFVERGPDSVLILEGAVPPGNAGSPLLDSRGRVVGILVGKLLSDRIFRTEDKNVAVALPIEQVRRVMAQAVEQYSQGKGYIGMSVVPLAGSTASSGVRVTSLAPGGAADRAGICPGDTIVGFEGEPVFDPGDLAQKVHKISPSTKVAFAIRKGKMTISRLVRVMEKP